MDYDVAIATRNRPSVLKLSLPLILRQSRKPQKLIIVDSSDDHEQVRQAVIQAVGESSVNLEILYAKTNLPHQRNVALEHVRSPVVMFPDDDSLWWPGVAEAIMRIYERDASGDIGGVCAADTKEPPPGIEVVQETGYKMNIRDRIQQQIVGVRHAIDRRICPSDWEIYGRLRWSVKPVPEWLEEENALLVEYMTGYRMSFRTDVIRKYGFNEDLGAYVGAASCEDLDVCFNVMQGLLLVGAQDAKVYHHRFPARRASGYDLGFIENFNHAYVICRYTIRNDRIRNICKRRTVYKLAKSMFGLHSHYGRMKFLGTLQAWRSIRKLMDTDRNHLRQCYLDLCKQAFCDRSKI